LQSQTADLESFALSAAKVHFLGFAHSTYLPDRSKIGRSNGSFENVVLEIKLHPPSLILTPGSLALNSSQERVIVDPVGQESNFFFKKTLQKKT
jgi:hypothetical protein